MGVKVPQWKLWIVPIAKRPDELVIQTFVEKARDVVWRVVLMWVVACSMAEAVVAWWGARYIRMARRALARDL
jgi:hypothetical protein